MRQALPSLNLSQPYVAIVCYTAAHVPSFTCTNFGVENGDQVEVTVNGSLVPILTNIENVNITEGRPTGLGTGLVRREVEFDIKNNGPFAQSPFTPQLYSAGASTDSFYFGVWVTDYSRSLEDILTTGIFFGFYKLDMGITWDESSLVTAMKLIEMPMLMTGRYNTNTEGAEDILDGSEWQRLIEAPAYLGYRGKVQAIGRVDSGISGYESYSKSVQAVIAGIVQSASLSGTSIQLGKSPTLASSIGSTVKMKFGNGCLVSGVITDLGGGEYGINTSGWSMNVAWDTIDIKNVGTLTPGTPLDLTFNANEVLLDTAPLTKIPSPTMYIKSPGNIEFYLAGVQTSATALWLKLTGISDEATKKLSCEDFKDPANPTWPRTGVNVNFDAAQQTTVFTGDDAHFNYANWLATQNYTLHFSNKTFVLADVQKEGMTWEIIITPHVNASISIQYTFYVRMVENTTIMENSDGVPALFYDDGKQLVTVPVSAIDAITYGNTDFGMVNMCKIMLKARPSDVNEAYDNNFLYVDTWPPMYAADVIKYILLQGGMHTSMLGATLTASVQLGNTLALEIKNETWTELLDSVMFESGLHLEVAGGLYHVVASFDKATIFTFNRGATTETYQWVAAQGDITFGDVVDNTYKFNIGRTFTNVDANGREYVRVHYSLQYTYSNYHGVQNRKLRSIKAAKDNDRIIDYTFKHISDSVTCRAAAIQITRCGHPANIAETTRHVEIGLPYKYCYLQALDVVNLQDFRHISALSEPLAAYDAASASNPIYTKGTLGVYARYTQTVPFLLIPGLYVVERITYNFSGEGVPVTVVLKQTQPATTSNLKDVAIELVVNTDVENTAAAATTPDTSTETAYSEQYYCPNGAVSDVIITPGEPTQSSPTVNDTCCNESSTTVTIYGDPIVTIACDGIPDNKWPAVCFAPYFIYPQITDNEIDSITPLVIPIWLVDIRNNVGAVLRTIECPGVDTLLSTCVSFTVGDMVEVPGYGHRLGTLYVYPCAFALPEDEYSKLITLTFDVYACAIYDMFDHDGDPNTPMIPTNIQYKTTVKVNVPVTLKPVSDITIG